ncbi:MAG: hypothetical protein ACR2IK_20960 [Chloroflexota bacterium]
MRHTETAALFMWREAFTYFEPGYGSAVAIVMTVVNALAAWAYIRVLGRRGATD